MSWTTVSSTYCAVHVAPQSIPAGLACTVPVPGPDFVTVTGKYGENFAVMLFVSSTVTVQSAAPEHAPDQPTNALPASGVATRLTSVGASNIELQRPPQA